MNTWACLLTLRMDLWRIWCFFNWPNLSCVALCNYDGFKRCLNPSCCKSSSQTHLELKHSLIAFRLLLFTCNSLRIKQSVKSMWRNKHTHTHTHIHTHTGNLSLCHSSFTQAFVINSPCRKKSNVYKETWSKVDHTIQSNRRTSLLQKKYYHVWYNVLVFISLYLIIQPYVSPFKTFHEMCGTFKECIYHLLPSKAGNYVIVCIGLFVHLFV